MELNSPPLPLPPPPPLKIKRMKQINNYTGLKYLGFWELKSGIPKLKIVKIRRYFCISAHSQCTDQGYTV